LTKFVLSFTQLLFQKPDVISYFAFQAKRIVKANNYSKRELPFQRQESKKRADNMRASLLLCPCFILATILVFYGQLLSSSIIAAVDSRIVDVESDMKRSYEGISRRSPSQPQLQPVSVSDSTGNNKTTRVNVFTMDDYKEGLLKRPFDDLLCKKVKDLEASSAAC
jgi:hypothetical protein